MKRLFMTFAAMLLMSVSAFAQSTPISKCDVNEDGKVDVADITAIISKIKSMQRNFYLGTIEPTAENYKSLSTTRTSMEDALGTTVSVDAGQTVYLLCPTSWIDQWSNVFIEDISGEAFDFSDDIDVTTIPEYSIYKTQTLDETSTMTLKIKHQNNYYIGATNQEVFTESYIASNGSYQATKPTSITVSGADDSQGIVNIWIYPSSWGQPTSMMNAGIESKGSWRWNESWLTVPAGYYGVTNYGESGTYTLTWE